MRHHNLLTLGLRYAGDSREVTFMAACRMAPHHHHDLEHSEIHWQEMRHQHTKTFFYCILNTLTELWYTQKQYSQHPTACPSVIWRLLKGSIVDPCINNTNRTYTLSANRHLPATLGTNKSLSLQHSAPTDISLQHSAPTDISLQHPRWKNIFSATPSSETQQSEHNPWPSPSGWLTGTLTITNYH